MDAAGYELPARDCHGRKRPRNDIIGYPIFHCQKSFVGRGHVPAGVGTTDCVQSLLVIPSAAYAVGGDMSPPYRGCVVYHGAFSRVDSEECSDMVI